MKRAGPTQADRILDMLHVAARDGGSWCASPWGVGGGVCGAAFLQSRMPRYSAVIHELRRRGEHIDNLGTCRTHNTAIYRLAQGQATLPI